MGKEKELSPDEAAAKLQATFKGHKTRKDIQADKQAAAEAERQRIEAERRQFANDEERAATAIQARYKGKKAREAMKKEGYGSIEALPPQTPTTPVTPSSVRRGKLYVKVISGESILAVDRNGSSDPFCEVFVGRKKESTPHISKTVTPSWNWEHTYECTTSEQLRIVVYDHNRFFPKKYLGEFVLPLYNLPPDVEDTKTQPLKSTRSPSTYCGTITFAVRFTPE
eukprot:GFYU01002876.1.p1 GENE.GFYU01002876.1~~GFYU01002876.1.p1  ORF type:complete len:225 (-),score=59.83 GFYU01002876.1:160-834(-)